MKLIILFLMWPMIGFAQQQDDKPELPAFHHVVGVKPSQARDIDEKLQLGEEGELVCSTCHGLDDIDKTPIDEVDTEAEDFLQGGPYKPLTDFCYRCHNKEKNTRENIHVMFDEKGEIKKQACEYCHEKTPDREKDLKFDELKLRISMTEICYGCHLKDPHFNAVEHQVKPETDEMMDHLKKMREEKQILMPLNDKNEVMCISCHTPHQRDVINVEKPAGKQVLVEDLEEGITYKDHPWNAVYQADKAVRLDELNKQLKKQYQLNYQRIENEALLRLPAVNGELCLQCHTFDK